MHGFHLTSVMSKSTTFDSIQAPPIRLEYASPARLRTVNAKHVAARFAATPFRIRFRPGRIRPKNVAMQDRCRYYTAQFRYAVRRSGALQNASDRFPPE